MKHEYHEGPKTGENFEKLARAVLQAPRLANLEETAQEEIYKPQNNRQRAALRMAPLALALPLAVERVGVFPVSWA
jgi:hypothetical protein